MRRVSFALALTTALAVPAAALAASAAPADGSLVVQNAAATALVPSSVPVVILHITGSVVGQVDAGKIIIASDTASANPEVNGAGVGTDSARVDNARVWSDWGGTGFKFRAVAGTFTILIYGTGIDLTAIGKGWVKLWGNADAPKADGRYSLNGNDWLSLPGVQSDKLLLSGNG